MPARTVRLLFVMDPIDSIKPAKDTTLAMMLSAQKRGWELWYAEQQDLWLRDGVAMGNLRRLGTLLGKLGINIANFNLGRAEVGGDAIALLSIDGSLEEKQLGEIAKLEGVKQAKALKF